MPVVWQQGQDVIIVPSLSDADAKDLFPSGWKTVKPYLRSSRSPSRSTTRR
jgi:thioredoxin-dependent peroxiredoxin